MTTLSEAASKELLARFGVTMPREQIVSSPAEAAEAAELIGFPVVLKLNGDAIAHKTERGLVRLNVRSADEARIAAAELLAAARPEDAAVGVLVAQQVRGSRELIAGVVRDPVFGPAVMLGLGGVLAEAVADVAFRLVPISPADAADLVDDLQAQRLFGPFRGEPAVDRNALCGVLLSLSAAIEANPDIRSIDINPIIIFEGRPVAADALVELV